MKVLICGGTGFIGSNILRHMIKIEEYEIYATYLNNINLKNSLSHKILNWLKVDLREENQVKSCIVDVKPDVIIQAAATTSGSKDIVNQPYLHVTDNAIMNSILLKEAMINEVKHFIFFSCTVMYSSSETPQKEEGWDPSQKINEKYFGVGSTKVYIENMLDFYSRISPMKTTAIRHSNIYGPGDKFDLDKSHVFGATITKVMTSEDEVTVWGKKKKKRDLLYIDDLVEFVELVIKKQDSKYQLYNCGYGEAVSISSLVSKIIKISGRNLQVNFDTSKPTIKTSLCLNCDKAYSDLNWSPKTNLEEGIRLTLEWWKNNFR